MEKEKEPENTYKFYFENPWCPLFGRILIPVDHIPDSPKFQCWETIVNARFLFDKDYPYTVREGVRLLDPTLPVLSGIPLLPDLPCEKCRKTKRKDWFQCNDFECKKFIIYTNKTTEYLKVFLCPDPEFIPSIDRTIIWSARAILDNFPAIQEHTLWWSPDDIDVVSLYGDCYYNTLDSVWNRTIEQTKEDVTYFNDGQTMNIDDDIPDYIILCILAISQAWYTLRDILYFHISEDDPNILKDVLTAKSLLARAIEQKKNIEIQTAEQKLADGKQKIKKEKSDKGKKKGEFKRKYWKPIAQKIKDENHDMNLHILAEKTIDELIKTNKTIKVPEREIKKFNKMIEDFQSDPGLLNSIDTIYHYLLKHPDFLS